MILHTSATTIIIIITTTTNLIISITIINTDSSKFELEFQVYKNTQRSQEYSTKSFEMFQIHQPPDQNCLWNYKYYNHI